MARNAAADGIPIRAWNRTAAKLGDLVGSDGVSAFETARDQRERLAPLFEAVGKRTMWVGEAGQGSRLKVVVDSWIVTVVEGAAEVLRLAESLGLDKELPLEAIEDGPLDQPYMRMKAEAMIAGDYTPSFRLALAAKDARLAVEAGEDAGAEIPAIAAIAEQMRAVAEHHGEEDLAALYFGREDSA